MLEYDQSRVGGGKLHVEDKYLYIESQFQIGLSKQILLQTKNRNILRYIIS
jgi:hypothetical protein